MGFRRSQWIQTRQAEPIRWLVLGASIAPVLGAFLYNQGFRLFDGPCFFQQMLGFPGPACGLTRSFMAIARWDWQQAIAYHAFGPVIFGVLVLAATHAAAELALGQPLSSGYAKRLTRPAPILIGVLLFFVYYAIRLYARYSLGFLPYGLSDLAVWQALVEGAQAL